MARSTFKVLFYLKRQAEQNGKAPIMGRITIVRDIFVFCCFMGPAYADVKKLTHDDIHTDGQGDLWIVDHRQKTGTQFRVKLLPVAKRLVERYSRLRLPGNKVFPVKDRDSMNMSLRHVARHAGLSFNPTMHEARHTFSTTVTLSQGVPLETVSKMLGHKHITTTQIYAKITNDKIGRDMDALSQKIAEKFYPINLLLTVASNDTHVGN